MKNLCLILAFLFIAVGPLQAAQKNPTLIVTTLDGENFDLKAKRGKVVVVTYWAHWCGYCRKEISVLNELYLKYKTSGLEVIAISIDPKDERKKVSEIASLLSYSSAMVSAIKETTLEEPNSIPVSYVIDRNGKLLTEITGSAKAESAKQDFEDILEPLLTTHP